MYQRHQIVPISPFINTCRPERDIRVTEYCDINKRVCCFIPMHFVFTDPTHYMENNINPPSHVNTYSSHVCVSRLHEPLIKMSLKSLELCSCTD